MAGSVEEIRAFRFGPFELDTRTCCLTREGHQERLALQPARLLLVLVQRPGELVTREELRMQLWPGDTFGDFDHGLNNAVNRLREALGDSAVSPCYIQTAPRRGYRFVAGVEAVGAVSPSDSSSLFLERTAADGLAETDVTGRLQEPDAFAVREPVKATRPARSIWTWLLAGVGLVVLLLTLLFRLRSAPIGPVTPIRSLAVLPLQDLSGKYGEEYFADGMTDALITELAHTPNLRVVSRTSVMQEKGTRKSLRQIAGELDADAVVEGSIVRSGDRIRITAQLIDARTDRHLWAETFVEPMNDVLLLQDKVVREIATHAQAALTPVRDGSAVAKVSPAAYDAYLRGLYFLHIRQAEKSAAYFRQAVLLDASYPAAYAGLADALTSARVLSVTKPMDTEAEALAAARHAIQLDPNSGEAYAALGFVELTYRKDWRAGGRDLERGLALSPNDSYAHLQYSLYLDSVGRPEDAVTVMREGLKLDPLSFVMNRHLGAVLYFARHYDEALIHLDHAAEMEPRNFAVVENWRARSYEMLGRLDEAERADLVNLSAWVPEEKLAPLRVSYARSGWKGYQESRIALLRKQPELVCGSFEIAESYLRLGDKERALALLKDGIHTSCFWADWMTVDPLMDALREDPRFALLVKQVGQPGTT